jgi:transposase-like protein
MNEMKHVVDFGEWKGDRRSTENSPKSTRPNRNGIAPTEVSTKKTRRRFTKEYKLSILKEIDTSTKPGQIGEILRREGLYSSNITSWRRQLEQGKFNQKLAGKQNQKITELSKQNRKLQRELNRSKLIIEAQKKILKLLEMEEED